MTKSRWLIGILALCMCGLVGCQLNKKTETIETIETTETTETTKQEEIVITQNGEKVCFSEESGVYEDVFTVKLSCEEDKEALIYYTLDGSNPITSSTRITYQNGVEITDRSGDKNVVSAVDPALFDTAYAYVNSEGTGFADSMTAPQDSDVDKCTVLRAAARLADGTYSVITNATYFVGDIASHIQGIKESCEAAGTSLAIVSISMSYEDLFDEETGIYVRGFVFSEYIDNYISNGDKLGKLEARKTPANYNQRGREWERQASITFLESDGEVTTCGFSQDCGIRIQGNFSRSDLQKGFRLYARNEYGDNNFSYAVFGDTLVNDHGEVMDKFKTLVLRNGGNCAFTTKYSDTYWQSLIGDLNCETQQSRPCIVYLNGEYWGLYVLEEDYSDDYFEETHGVDKDQVIVYKGDAETYECGYKLDVGDLPEGETSVDYYFEELYTFFDTHNDLSNDEDYEEFVKLVDPDSVMDYFAVEIWINNKWDWPGKNWSMWRTTYTDETNEYADERFRFCFYDLEFGGVSGSSDATTNTIKEDNYKPDGMLDDSTGNPAVLCFVYLMSNQKFRTSYIARLTELSMVYFAYDTAIERLDQFKNTYTPLYDQFFTRYQETGSAANSNYGGYASYSCISDFLSGRAAYLPQIISHITSFY